MMYHRCIILIMIYFWFLVHDLGGVFRIWNNKHPSSFHSFTEKMEV
jgi:hypothetical protein